MFQPRSCAARAHVRSAMAEMVSSGFTPRGRGLPTRRTRRGCHSTWLPDRAGIDLAFVVDHAA